MAASVNLRRLSIRITTGLVGGFLVLVWLQTSPPLLLLGLMFAGSLALWEFARSLRMQRFPLLLLFGFALLNFSYYLHYLQRLPRWEYYLVLFLAFAVAELLLLRLPPDAELLTQLLAFVAGVLLLSGLGYLIRLYFASYRIVGAPIWGLPVLLLPVVFAWGYDTSAYFAGKFFGRLPFSPTLSPQKTWEGLAGGLTGTAAATGLLWFLLSGLRIPVSSLPLWLAIGVGMGVLAQLGDLFFSFVKRVTGIKHYGTLLPGHGGLLDRIDSFVFVLPLSYAFLPLLFREFVGV